MAKSIQDIVKNLNAQRAKGSSEDQPLVFVASDRPDLLGVEYTPCNVPELNEALGGGFASKAIYRLSGTEGVGKTALALSVGAEYQKKGKWVIYVMGEPPFPQQTADEVGLDMGMTIILNPLDYGEQLVDAVYAFLYDPDTRSANGEVGLVIWDSINTIVPKSAINRQEDKGSEAAGMAERPRLLADFLGKILGRGMLRGGTTIILIAQLSTALGEYGTPTKASGGNAVKFDSKVLINLRKKLLPKTKIDDYQVYSGHDVIFEIEKNNIDGKPGGGKYTYIPGVGIDDSLSLFNRGLEEGYITLAGRANYLFDIPGFEPVTVAKKADAQAYLKQDKERRDALRTALRTPKKKATRMVEAVAVETEEPVIQTIDEQDNE